jgi:hypothetical protein
LRPACHRGGANLYNPAPQRIRELYDPSSKLLARKRRDLYKEDSTDQRGHFTIHGLNPGHYTVLAFEDLQDDYHEPDFLKSYEGRGQSVEIVEIKEGEQKTVQLKIIPSTDDQP